MSASHDPEACPLALLATSEIGRLAVCRDCGTVHLLLGDRLVRMHPRAFLELAAMAAVGHDALLRIAGAKMSDEPGAGEDARSVRRPEREPVH
jgi:hypothetical protein